MDKEAVYSAFDVAVTEAATPSRYTKRSPGNRSDFENNFWPLVTRGMRIMSTNGLQINPYTEAIEEQLIIKGLQFPCLVLGDELGKMNAFRKEKRISFFSDPLDTPIILRQAEIAALVGLMAKENELEKKPTFFERVGSLINKEEKKGLEGRTVSLYLVEPSILMRKAINQLILNDVGIQARQPYPSPWASPTSSV